MTDARPDESGHDGGSRMPRALLCDFDGTLVDSAAGVLSSVQWAFDRCGLRPAVPVTTQIIGPPLTIMLRRLCGDRDDHLPTLSAAFREHYDGGGCLESQPYAGVDATLRAVAERGTRLFIVTNKRAVPTCRVIAHLRWIGLFEAVYCIDQPPFRSAGKSTMAAELIRRFKLDVATTELLGDSVDDAVAAVANGLRFLAADWGYGTSALRARAMPMRHLRCPSDLLNV